MLHEISPRRRRMEVCALQTERVGYDRTVVVLVCNHMLVVLLWWFPMVECGTVFPMGTLGGIFFFRGSVW